jgi:hypothetical protein
MRRAARMTRRPRASAAFAGTTNKGATAEYDELDYARFRGGDDKRLVVSQSVETVREYCGPECPVEFEARFDEFRLDVRLAYRGTPLELPERRPSEQEIMSTEAGHLRLAGYVATQRRSGPCVTAGRARRAQLSLRSLRADPKQR